MFPLLSKSIPEALLQAVVEIASDHFQFRLLSNLEIKGSVSLLEFILKDPNLSLELVYLPVPKSPTV